jgi:hypothetical protein
MKQLPYIQTSTAIIGYNDSLLAQTESNDCFVRSVASAYNVHYEKAHSWVKKYFKRKNNQGTYNVVMFMEQFARERKMFNGKRVKTIEKIREYDSTKLRFKRTTLNQFMKKHSKGTYIVIVSRHAFTVMNGFVIGNSTDSTQIKKVVHNAFKIS